MIKFIKRYPVLLLYLAIILVFNLAIFTEFDLQPDAGWGMLILTAFIYLSGAFAGMMYERWKKSE